MSKNAVIYIVKGKHTQLLAVSLSSLVKNYKSVKPLDVIIIEDVTIPTDKDILAGIPSFYNNKYINIKIARAPSIASEVEGAKVEIDSILLWRLFLPYEYSEYEKILYLDNDTILYCDVNELFEKIEDDKVLAAIPDFYFYVQSDIEDLGAEYDLKTTKSYFNAGVLVFNTSNYVGTFEKENIISIINQNKYPWTDQTILNVMCEDRTTLLQLAYNYQKNDFWLNSWAKVVNPEVGKELQDARNNVKIRHFIEYERFSMPWEHLYIADEFEMYFWDYKI